MSVQNKRLGVAERFLLRKVRKVSIFQPRPSSIRFNLILIVLPSTRRLLTNSSDRILRQFNLPASYPQELESDENPEQELEPTYRFSDPISRVAWHNMAYSPDGEWVAGGKQPSEPQKVGG